MSYFVGIQIISVFFLHWLADFPGQDSEWGLNKHHDFKLLLLHTLVYSFIFSSGVVILYGGIPAETLGKLFAITFFSHTLTDFCTSRWNARAYADKKYKLWINSIGFDQWLHQAQIILTLVYLHIIQL